MTKAKNPPNPESLLMTVHGADGFLSFARHNPAQWSSFVEMHGPEIDQIIGRLRRDVVRFMEGAEVDKSAAWNDLVQAAAALGAALATFDNALDAYKKAKEAGQ